MNNFHIFWAETVIKHRFFVIIMFLGLLGLSILSIIKFPLNYDNSFEMFMLKDDPNIVRFEKFRDLFGDAEYLSIGITARPTDPDVFVSKTIAVIDEISSMLEEHEFVTKVSSISNYQYTHSANGSLATDYLFDEPSSLKDEGPELALAREIMINETLAHERLITKDLQNTRILVRTEYIRNENNHKIKISNDIYEFLIEKNYEADGYKIRLGGGAIIAERFEYLSKRDSAILNPLVAFIMCLIIYNLFGSFLVCFLPWVLIGTSIVVVSGLQAWLQFPKTVVNGALIPTLMIIGMGVSVHILSEFFQSRRGGDSPLIASRITIENLLKPIFFTALTTAIGFCALAVTELLPVKQYAVLAAFGSLVIFFVASTFLVSVISYLPLFVNKREFLKTNSLIIELTRVLPSLAKKYRRIIMFLAIGSVLFCALTVPKISVDSNIFNYFKSNNWINQDMRYFDEIYKFSGIELVIDSGETDGVKEPDFLKRVETLEGYLNSLEKTGKVNSAIEFLKKLRQSFNYGDNNFFILPDNSEMAAQLLLLYENSGPEDDLSDLIDFENQYLRLSLPIQNSSATAFAEFYDFIRERVAEQFPDLSVQYTGPMVLYNAQEVYINNGLRQSFSFALLMIGFSFFLLFKSIKYGVIALFPSVLPILIVGGSTIFLGISLDLGTIIVGAMCMGIAVDDAIHVMARYLKYKELKYSTRRSVDLAVKESGKAVIFTSLILVFGFSAMLFASLVPTILFGVFAAMILGLALLGDLFVLPALLFIFDNN